MLVDLSLRIIKSRSGDTLVPLFCVSSEIAVTCFLYQEAPLKSSLVYCQFFESLALTLLRSTKLTTNGAPVCQYLRRQRRYPSCLPSYTILQAQSSFYRFSDSLCISSRDCTKSDTELSRLYVCSATSLQTTIEYFPTFVLSAKQEGLGRKRAQKELKKAQEASQKNFEAKKSGGEKYEADDEKDKETKEIDEQPG